MNGVAREHLDRIAAGNSNAVPDVHHRFGKVEAAERAAQLDPLFQLAEPFIVQSIGELRLADEHQGHELLAVGFDVCQHPKFFEQLV